MRIRHTVLVLLFVAAAACGGGNTSTTPPTTTTTATTVPSTTTTSVPSTTVDPIAARVAAASALAGEYTGTWSNTTFGSTGSVTAVVTVDATAGTVTIDLDLGGTVFGAADPDPTVITFDLAGGGPYSGANEVFGEFTLRTDGLPDRLDLDAPSVPGLGGLALTVEIELSEDGITGAYTIPQLPAQGTIQATRS